MSADPLAAWQINITDPIPGRGDALAAAVHIRRAERTRNSVPNSESPPVVIDAAHLARQREFSRRTFGPDPRTQGIIDHIRKELLEIEAAPRDLSEWADVVILALDGAWRAGHDPQAILDAIVAKQAINEARVWPDWRTASPDKPIEHDRSNDSPANRPDPAACGTR